MLVVPKTVAPLYSIQNALARFDFGIGVDFNWVGLCSMHRKGVLGPANPHRIVLNVRNLWEITCLKPTRDITTESVKVVTAAIGTPTTEIFQGPPVATTTTPPTTIPQDAELPAGATMVRFTWDDVLVDGDTGDPELDRLKVIVEAELRVDEPFLRWRIRATWIKNNRVDGDTPGRFAIWRVRFPIVDVTPGHASNVLGDEDWEDVEGEDLLFIPENHGQVFNHPTVSAAGTAEMGRFAPQDRAEVLRNEVRPAGVWREAYPGRISTQAMGYCANTSRRGVLLGCLDHVGHRKEFSAYGQDGSICMEIVHVPAWSYSIGNRPSGFTGSFEGDSIEAFESLAMHAPQSEILTESPEGPIPDTRSIDAGPKVTPDAHTASLGFAQLGALWLGTLGLNVNRSLDLGYVSPFDIALAPVQVSPNDGWQKLAEHWRGIADLPDSAFPLLDKRNAAALHPAATAKAVLDLDTTVHQGQETLFGLDDADMETAHNDRAGSSTLIAELIKPKVVVESRAIDSDVEVVEEDSLTLSGPLVNADGVATDIENYSEGRGGIRLYGEDGFYVAPVQVAQNWFQGQFQSVGWLKFRTFNALTAGVKPGDIVRLIRRIGDGPAEWPDVGRAQVPVASNSETIGTNQDSIRIVKEVISTGPNAGGLIIGKYVNGELVPWNFSPLFVNNPGRYFEVEILRREVNVRTLYEVTTLPNGNLKTQINIPSDVIETYFPMSSLSWGQIVRVGDTDFTFKKLYVDDFIAYLEVSGGSAAELQNKSATLRRVVEPIYFDSTVLGQYLQLQGSVRNEKLRKVEFRTGDLVTEELADGILRFEQILETERVKTGVTFALYSATSSSGRVLGPESDLIWEGKRFIDEGYAADVAGGFRKSVAVGDLLILESPANAENEDPFEVTEVLDDWSFLVDRPFVTEAAGLSYHVLRRGRLLRDVRSLRTAERDFFTGVRRALPGVDRVHVLAIGWVADPTADITGVYGVDSASYAALGANPFIPATSINLTTYRTSPRGTRKPSREFVIAEVRGASEILVEDGWDLEDSYFSVTFDDIGARTFEKNLLQYRIVRDTRAEDAAFTGTKRAVADWARSLETSALFALLRGWQPKILGFDQPDFLPPRGKYLEVVKALAVPSATAIDVFGLDPDDEDGLYDELKLQAAAYYNRFGTRQRPSVSGGAAVGEVDRLSDPQVPHWRDTLLAEVLKELVKDGVPGFLFEQAEASSREPFGSPHFHDFPNYQVTLNGGGSGFIEGFYRMLSALSSHAAGTQPADWALGKVGLSTKDWEPLEREYPTADLLFPIDGEITQPIAGCSVVNNIFIDPNWTMSALRATLYGIERAIEPGDELELLPTGERFEIGDVGDGIDIGEPDSLSGITGYRIHLRRNLAREFTGPATFFQFAFAEYATVAADITFLANYPSWSEVVAKAAQFSAETWAAAVEHVYRRSMYRIALNVLHGILPTFRSETEAPSRFPATFEGVDLVQPGTSSVVEQASQLLPIGTEKRRLIGEHLAYFRAIRKSVDDMDPWVRYGVPEFDPPVEGATSLLMRGVVVGGGLNASAVLSSAWVNTEGDRLFLFSHWAPVHVGGAAPEQVTTRWKYADRGIASGYWTKVEFTVGQRPTWAGWVDDVDADPDAEREASFPMLPLSTRRLLVYEQKVLIRKDESDVEVDRVLVVPKWHSVAAAFAAIALDVVKGGSGNYVVVVGAGALADGLDIPSIPGATISLQNSADENPEVSEAP